MELKAMSRGLAMVALALAFGTAATATALEPGKDGWYHTGKAIRQKSIAMFKADVYEIHHAMKELPPAKTKAAVIAMDTDKKLWWVMLRDVGPEKMQDALRNGYAMNGFTDKAKIEAFAAAFATEMKEGAKVTIRYETARKATTIDVEGGGAVTIEGLDFMRATWSVWLGKIDQDDLGDKLISAL
ncbi:chalcone isomerase family protein [Myxococcota bacterium]|nr:chalcone isomerase family protein [Myxococcota bacterium]